MNILEALEKVYEGKIIHIPPDLGYSYSDKIWIEENKASKNKRLVTQSLTDYKCINNRTTPNEKKSFSESEVISKKWEIFEPK